MNFFSRTDKSFIGQWWWTVDRVTLAILLTICIFGVVLVTAASPAVAERINASPNHFIIRHIIYLFPSIALLVGLSMANLQYVWRAALLVLGFSCFLLRVVTICFASLVGRQHSLRFLHW